MSDKINGRTPEEIKRGLLQCSEDEDGCNCEGCPYDMGEFTCKCIPVNQKDALAYIQQLESAQPKWISVEERLPQESETVLVYRDGCCGVARLLDVEPVIMWTYTGFGGDPTHWMPLPKAPKEG